MKTAEQRVAFIINSVVQQALADTGLKCVRFVEQLDDQTALIEHWCNVNVTDDHAALALSAANKTELLLVAHRHADLYPLGDLYASEIEALSGSCVLSAEVMRIAQQAGGVTELDAVLRALFDEGRPPDEAYAAVPHLRGDLTLLLERNRFHRMRIGVVPKIGARTLGIDLFI